MLYRSDIVDAVLKCDAIKEKLIARLMTLLSEECKHLCSIKFNSMLRKCNPQQLLDFSVESLMSEWQQDAPLLHRFLVTTASSTGAPTIDQTDTTNLYGWLYSVESKKYPHVCFPT
jgi:hypothetical protein